MYPLGGGPGAEPLAFLSAPGYHAEQLLAAGKESGYFIRLQGAGGHAGQIVKLLANEGGGLIGFPRGNGLHGGVQTV